MSSVDPLSLASTLLARGQDVVKFYDVADGALAQNTQAAASWNKALSSLCSEIEGAKYQLHSVEGVVEKLRVSRGPGAEEANRLRLEIGLEKLIQEFVIQLQASENAYLTSKNEFEAKGFFGWMFLEFFQTKARSFIAGIESRHGELKKIRARVYDARERVMETFLLSHGSTGGRYPTLESLGHIRDELASTFLWPNPFCKIFETEDVLASGLLQCNTSDINLDALRKKIQEMGLCWVHQLRNDAANRVYEKRYAGRDAAIKCYQGRPSTVDMLEGCRGKVLVQLKGVFNTIMENNAPKPTSSDEGIASVSLTASEGEQAIIEIGAPFTSEDYSIAMRGLYALEEWTSICLEAGSGIVIALGGKMSAGKSSIINAMLGKSLLPTGRLVCTAVPTRLRHVSGKRVPTLSIPCITPYVKCLEWIKTQKIESNYNKPEHPMRYQTWKNFVIYDKHGRTLLDQIDGCSMPEAETEGQNAIDQLEILNSLVRICRTFGEEVDLGYPNQWPMISVEFTGLKYYCQNHPGPFTLLDLPGYNDDISKDTERFTELMTRAARQADVMVPVIAGPNLTTDETWAKHIIRSEWSTKISSAILTKRDKVSNMILLQDKLSTVATMCELQGHQDCLLLCDTLEGMAAMQLQILLDEIEREINAAIERRNVANPIGPEEIEKREEIKKREEIQRLKEKIPIVIAGTTDTNSPFHPLFSKGSQDYDYVNFTLNDWRELVGRRLDTSQLRQTCNQFAGNSTEKARRLRLARFIGEMEGIIADLVSSLSLTLGRNRTSLDANGASLEALKYTLSDLQNVLNQWTPRIEMVRAQQEGKLNEVLAKFERAAKVAADEAYEQSVAPFRLDGGVHLQHAARDGADEAFEMNVRPFRVDEGVYLQLEDGKTESILEKCHEKIFGGLTHVVDDAIRDLRELWKENLDAVPSHLRTATADITTHWQLTDLIKNTIDELEKVIQLDGGKLRVHMSNTPGEEVVVTTRNTLSHRMRIRMKRAIPAQVPEERKRTRTLSLLKQTFSLPRGTKALEPRSAPTTPVPVSPPAAPVGCSDAPIAVANVATTSDENFAAMALFPVNMADTLRDIVPELRKEWIAKPVTDNPFTDPQVEDQGPLKLNQEELRQSVLATSLHPLISRMQANAKASMTESLNGMWALAQQTVENALNEYGQEIKRKLKAQGSDDYEQDQAMTLKRLNCWGNLVAASSVVREMREMLNEPVVQVTPSGPRTFSQASPACLPAIMEWICPRILEERLI